MERGFLRALPARFRSRGATIAWAIFAMMAIYYVLPVLPVTGVEGDDYAIAVGALRIARTGENTPGFTYRYDVQSGTYQALIWLHKATGVETLTLFCTLSALSAVAFVAFGMLLVSHLTKLPLPLSGVLLLIFPETPIEAYYGNSTIIAAALGLAGLYVLAARYGEFRLLLGGALLGIAVWMRFDAILLTPVVPVLLMSDDGDPLARWRAARVETAVVAVVVMAVAGALLWASGADMLRVFSATGAHRVHNYPLYAWFMNTVAFLNVPVLGLLAIGLYVTVRRKAWCALAAAALGVAPVIVAYSGMLSTPKYYLYAVPFLALVAAPAADTLFRPKTRAAKALAGVLLAFTLVQALAPVDLSAIDRVVSWRWIGPIRGSMIRTDDHRRALTGTAYSPLMWLADKRRYARQHADITEAFATLPDSVDFYRVPPKWRELSHFRHRYVLMTLGYEFVGQELTPGVRLVGTWRRGERILRCSWEPTNITGFE